MNKKNKAWKQNIQNYNNKSNVDSSKKTQSQNSNDQQYIWSAYKKDKKYESLTVLNQFICLECNGLNLVQELSSKQTKLYADKDIPCRCCGKTTTQVCVIDKEITRAILEVTPQKTEKEKQVLDAILKKKNNENSNRPKVKEKHSKTRKPNRGNK